MTRPVRPGGQRLAIQEWQLQSTTRNPMMFAQKSSAARASAAARRSRDPVFVRPGGSLVSEGQIAAFAMAVCLRGMGREECVALTQAMTDSGDRLDWSRAKLHGPLLDKHSTGGVGDKTSLVLAPPLPAAALPMVSGRGLGHTGGTLDKARGPARLATVTPRRATLVRVLREAGCAIVGANARIAPADRRLYAIRDVTATVGIGAADHREHPLQEARRRAGCAGDGREGRQRRLQHRGAFGRHAGAQPWSRWRWARACPRRR